MPQQHPKTEPRIIFFDVVETVFSLTPLEQKLAEFNLPPGTDRVFFAQLLRDAYDKDQSIYYGRVGGCVVTGNEDGIKHCAMTIFYALQHLGYTIPPQADAGWIGEAGPGASYADEDSGGPENDFTQRNATFMAWNLMHLAQLLKSAGGIPAHGNQRQAWQAGCRFDHPNPDYR